MSAEQNLNPQDLELLSAYLDNMLNDAERSALEARLADDGVLRAELDGLRTTIALIKSLPTLKAPRNFTLTPAMVKSRTETGAPEMVKSRTETGMPQLVKSKTETGRIIRFPMSAVMSAAASFVFILVGMILVFGSVNQPNATKAPSDEIAYLPTVQPVANQTTFGAGAMDASYTDEAQTQDPVDDVGRTIMVMPTMSMVAGSLMTQPTMTMGVVAEAPVEQENQPASPVEEMGNALYAVPPSAESTPAETQVAQDAMPIQPISTISLTQDVVALSNNQATVVQATAENITETSMRQLATTLAPVPVVSMPTVTDDLEVMNSFAETTPLIADSVMDMAMTIPPVYATGFVEVMSNVPEPTWEVLSTITPQPQMPQLERTSSTTNPLPFVGIGLMAAGIVIAIILIWRMVRGTAS